MKKINYLASVVLLTLLGSCAPKLHYSTNVGYIDYSQFANEGIFLTESNSVNFEYTSIGSVSVAVLSGNVDKQRPNKYNYKDLYGKEQDEKYSEWVTASPEQAIKLAVEKAKEQGGNGIINIKVEPYTDISDKVARSGFLLSGMVIKK